MAADRVDAAIQAEMDARLPQLAVAQRMALAAYLTLAARLHAVVEAQSELIDTFQARYCVLRRKHYTLPQSRRLRTLFRRGACMGMPRVGWWALSPFPCEYAGVCDGAMFSALGRGGAAATDAAGLRLNDAFYNYSATRGPLAVRALIEAETARLRVDLTGEEGRDVAAVQRFLSEVVALLEACADATRAPSLRTRNARFRRAFAQVQ